MVVRIKGGLPGGFSTITLCSKLTSWGLPGWFEGTSGMIYGDFRDGLGGLPGCFFFC